MAVASSPSGDMIATSCKATTAEHAVIRLYETATWQQILPPLAGHTLTITRIVFSPDGQYILSCSRDRTWRLFRKKEGEHGMSHTLSLTSLIADIDCSFQASNPLPPKNLTRESFGTARLGPTRPTL